MKKKDKIKLEDLVDEDWVDDEDWMDTPKSSPSIVNRPISLKSAIVDAYSAILELTLWLVIIICAIMGYNIVDNVFNEGGWLGIVLGALGGFIIDAIVFGTLALILDIRDTLKEIAKKIT